MAMFPFDSQALPRENCWMADEPGVVGLHVSAYVLQSSDLVWPERINGSLQQLKEN